MGLDKTFNFEVELIELFFSLQASSETKSCDVEASSGEGGDSSAAEHQHVNGNGNGNGDVAVTSSGEK